MKTILFVNSSSRLYGADKSLLELLSVLDKKRFTLVLLLPEDGPLAREVSNYDIKIIITQFAHGERRFLRLFEFLMFMRNTAASARLIKSIIIEEHIDLVHSNTSSCFASAIAAKMAKKKHIWHIRELLVKPKLVKFLYQLLLPLLADRAIGASQAVKNNYCSYWNGLGRIFAVLPHGIDSAKYENATGILRREYSIPADTKIIGNVGMIRLQKGQEAFLLTARLIKQKYSPAKFVIAGDLYYEQGKIDPHLLEICASHGLNDDVLFTGFRKDIENIFASFDVFVHTSLSQEAYGRTILEAMAAGKPVVAFDSGGPRELVIDGTTGFLVPVGDVELMSDCIVRLLKDGELRVRMGREAKRVFTENFSMAEYGREIERLYDDTLERERPRAY